MAVKVILRTGSNGASTRIYEDATKFERDDHYLLVFNRTKQIAEHAAGTWESVEVVEMLDVKAYGEPAKGKVTGVKGPKKKAEKARTTKTRTREGADIRTSPLMGDTDGLSNAQRGARRR